MGLGPKSIFMKWGPISINPDGIGHNFGLQVAMGLGPHSECIIQDMIQMGLMTQFNPL